MQARLKQKSKSQEMPKGHSIVKGFGMGKSNKKAQVNKLTGFALTLVVFTIVLAVGLSVLSKLNTNLTAGTAEQNATQDMIGYMGEIPGWIPVIIVAMIGGIVLFLVIKQFGGN